MPTTPADCNRPQDVDARTQVDRLAAYVIGTAHADRADAEAMTTVAGIAGYEPSLLMWVRTAIDALGSVDEETRRQAAWLLDEPLHARGQERQPEGSDLRVHTVVDLGSGHSAELVRTATGDEHVVHHHAAADGEACSSVYVVVGGPGDRLPRVGIERRDPLTLDRPLGCAGCGLVGWVIEGHWSEGGRRRTLRRHPPTSWADPGGPPHCDPTRRDVGS